MNKKVSIFIIAIWCVVGVFLILNTLVPKALEVKNARNELQQTIETLPVGTFTTASYQSVIKKRNEATNLLKNPFATLTDIKNIKKEYSLNLQKLQKAKNCKYIITFETKLIFNQHVGNDWSFHFYFQNEEIKSGDVLQVSLSEPIVIKTLVIENDKIPDKSEKDFSIFPHNSSNTTEIEIKENRGRYIGNKAKWDIVCKLKQKELF